MKNLLITGLLLAVLLIGGCGGTPFTTATETVTVTVTATPTPTVPDAPALRDFLAAARQRYADGLTCNGVKLQPDLRISEQDFSGLEVNSGSILLFSGLPYFYVAIPHELNGLKDSVKVDQFTVVFDDPDPEAIRLGGGYQTRTRVYQGDTWLGETVFTGASSFDFQTDVQATLQEAGGIKIVSIGYRPDCTVPVRAVTLVLAPVPPPSG